MAGFGPKSDKQGNVVYPGFTNTTAPGSSRVQRLETGAQRIQRGLIRPTAGSYLRMPVDLLHTNKNQTQVLDVSKVFVRKVGGVSVAGKTGTFAYLSDSSSITWYWDGTNGSTVPVINRADGTRFTVPTAGSGLQVTGLSANTTYYFLPFWNVNNLCNIGWVQGTVGAPQIAFVVADTTDPANNPFYLMQQTLQQNEPLTSGYMTAATTVSGSGGGGAGGGGGGEHGCVMSGTDIETVGDLGYSLEVLPETQWIHLRTKDYELYCTYDHPLYHAAEGKIRADELKKGDLVITAKGEQELLLVEPHQRKCSKYRVHMQEGHLFWANGYCSHNVKP